MGTLYHFDPKAGDEGVGEVEIGVLHQGLNISVNGKLVAFIDLYPCLAGEPAKLVIDGPNEDEPLAFIVLDEDGPTVVVRADAERLDDYPHTITYRGDTTFREVRIEE